MRSFHRSFRRRGCSTGLQWTEEFQPVFIKKKIFYQPSTEWRSSTSVLRGSYAGFIKIHNKRSSAVLLYIEDLPTPLVFYIEDFAMIYQRQRCLSKSLSQILKKIIFFTDFRCRRLHVHRKIIKRPLYVKEIVSSSIHIRTCTGLQRIKTSKGRL